MSEGSYISPWIVDGVRGPLVLGSSSVGDGEASTFKAGESEMLGSAEMDPGDIRTWYIDFAPLLNGETVSTTVWDITGGNGLVKVSDAIDVQRASIKLTAAAGMVATTYRVRCQVTSATSSSKYRRSFNITVKNL